MPETKHILTFILRNEHFAIDALVVKEIIYLPELTLEEEVPDFIAGAFNLRGKVVHVMDLNIRFGYQPQRYSLSDKVVVLDLEGSLLGIIVSDVLDVISISESEIEQLSAVRLQPSAHLIAGEAKVGEEILMVIDHNKMRETGLVNREAQIQDTNHELRDTRYEIRYFPPSVTPEEKAVFHARVLNLMKEAVVEVEGLAPLAVFSLNSEYYGAHLEAIQEFSDIYSVTPVPCCPPHIIGDMNLRGDILTLVDVRGVLNMPLRKETIGQKAIVARVNENLAGIPVDEVFEVIYVNPSGIRPVPTATVSIGDEYIKGEVAYRGKMLSILDLNRILTWEELVVND